MRRLGVPPVIVSFLLLLGLLVSPPAAAAQSVVLFDEKVKIPYGLRLDSVEFPPGEYRLQFGTQQGTPTLSLKSGKGAMLGRITGEQRENVPEGAEKLGKGRSRLKILPIPNSESPNSRWIVFIFEFKGPRSEQPSRWTFRLREAEKGK
ncbi:MAG: hypothetical protein HY656_03525 [Acidobacteria bacterium]|nr:hypothetical protein [Acidobacteriota bacterium]